MGLNFLCEPLWHLCVTLSNSFLTISQSYTEKTQSYTKRLPVSYDAIFLAVVVLMLSAKLE